MKLLHTADLHLDSECTAHFTKEQAKQRRNELLHTFTRLVDYAADVHAAAILISGDLFDKKTVSKTAANTVYQAVKQHPGILFFYLRGNHDAKGFLELFDELPGNLKLFTEEWRSYPIGDGSVVVTGVEVSKYHPEIYDALALQPEKINLVMMHGQEVPGGGKNDAEVIRLKELRNRNIDYLALGHVHGYKKAELDARGVYVYPGCPEGRGFDECGEKGFVLIDIDETDRSVDSYFVPFAAKQLYSVETDISDTGDTAEIIAAVKETLALGRVPDGAFVKVTLTGSFDAEDEKNVGFIEESFRDRYGVFRVKDESSLHVDYRRYEGDVSLKGEFIRLVESSDLSAERKAAVIRTGLQALRGEGVQA